MNLNDRKNYIWGTVSAFLSYLLWGILPLYWKLLNSMPAWNILAHRIVWSFVFFMIAVFATRQWKFIKEALSNRRNMFLIFLSSLMITANWGMYIWAVNAGHVLDVSLGYYINPLLSVLLGVLFFKEKLNKPQIAAVILAGTGVLVITLHYRQVPWIACILAVTFAVYGALKKHVCIQPVVSLFIETAMVLPFALLYLGVSGISETAVMQPDIVLFLILMGTGTVTAVPLLLFAIGARRISLTTLGFTQYVSPTTSLLLGVFVFKEPFTFMRFIGFSFIWLALFVYATTQLRAEKGFRQSSVKQTLEINK